jgi:outer membrane protein assembly factor BamB
MSTSPANISPPSGSPVVPLRVWPAMVLIALLALFRYAHVINGEYTPQLFMLTVFGPMLLGLLAAGWWLFASKATKRERWLGGAALAAIGVVGFLAADKSMQGMSFFFFPYPISLAVFLVLTTLLGRWLSTKRTIATVVAVLAVYAYCDLIRMEGLTGDFDADIAYRWQPTAEDRLLATSKSPSVAAASTEPLGVVTWSEFRGPHRDAVVPGVDLATDWQAQPPREVWRKKIGPGWSSFAIAGNRLFTQEQRGENELVVCYDANTGEERWRHETPARFWESVAGAGPRATPTLAQGGLFALGATGVLARFDPVNGKVVWQRNLKDDSQRDLPVWGFSSSPLVVGDVVVVHAGGQGDKGLFAYDIADGKLRWQVAAGDHSYASAQLATVAGRESLLMLTNDGLTAHDPATGKLLWDHPWKFGNYRAVQPLVVDAKHVLLGTGMGAGTRYIEIEPGEPAPKINTLWTTAEMKPDYNDYVAHKGYLYGFDHNIFSCIDLATGKRLWKKGRYGNGQVLLLPDADQLLVLSESGEAVLLRTNPEKLDELARHQVLEGKTWNHPALVGNRLYSRNGEEMSCFELPVTTVAGK